VGEQFRRVSGCLHSPGSLATWVTKPSAVFVKDGREANLMIIRAAPKSTALGQPPQAAAARSNT